MFCPSLLGRHQNLFDLLCLYVVHNQQIFLSKWSQTYLELCESVEKKDHKPGNKIQTCISVEQNDISMEFFRSNLKHLLKWVFNWRHQNTHSVNSTGQEILKSFSPNLKYCTCLILFYTLFFQCVLLRFVNQDSIIYMQMESCCRAHDKLICKK